MVVKDRDGGRREWEFLRQGRRFIPVDRQVVPTGDWGVVQAYLEVHGEAIYPELLNALERVGVRMTERALQQRVKRWERRGRVVIERRGFPPTAFVKLAAAHFTHSCPLWQTYEQNEQNEQNGEHEEVAANLPVLPVLPILPILHTPSRSVQNDNPTDCPNHDLPESYDLRSETDAEWLARAEQVLDQFYLSFHDRVELAWDTIDDWLQQASQPNDPLGLEPHEVEALMVLLAFAEAQGFPSLTLQEYGYTIQAGQEGWLAALPDIAGTPAVAIATRLLSDTAGSPAVPAHTRTNGDAGQTPSQFSLEV